MHRLNPQERLFLSYTRPGVRWYSMVVVLCEPPEDALRPRVATLRELASGRLHEAPSRFRQRVITTPLNIASPIWVDDPDFDITRHIGAAELGPPATGRDGYAAASDSPAAGEDPTSEQFERYVCRLAGGAMEMDRPLWDVHVAERLADGRAALVIRAHHAMLDGTGMASFVALLADLGPEPAAAEAPRPWSPAPVPTSLRVLTDDLRDMVARTGQGLRAATREATRAPSLAAARRSIATVGTLARELAPSRPPPELSRQPSAQRALSLHECSLDALRAIAHRHGAKVNDVVAAIATDALRRFLSRRGEAPRRTKALIPTAVEGPDEGSDEEHVGFMTVVLPVDESDPDARLREIAEQTRQQKELHAPERVEWFLERLGRHSDLAYRLSQHIVQNPHSASFTISNVRGPGFPIWVRGARVTELYPVVPLGPGHDLAVGVVSLESRLFAAIVRDPRAAPELDAFPACVDAAIAALPPDYAAASNDTKEGNADG